MTASLKVSFGFILFIFATASLKAQDLFRIPNGTETRWSSFENPSASKGSGGSENKKAKGHPSTNVAPGQTKVLLIVKGSGVIQRLWMTINDRSPAMLRSLRLEMYWDDQTKPAVSVPLGDFFGVGLRRKVSFQNALFSDPEGRSFTCYIPMPYQKGARVTLKNESGKAVMLFYDINFQQVKSLGEDAAYFHAYWSRALKTELGRDHYVDRLRSPRDRRLSLGTVDAVRSCGRCKRLRGPFRDHDIFGGSAGRVRRGRPN